MKKQNVQRLNRICLIFGAVLAAGELYKQFFLYFAVNGGSYDWWDLPFQLCSLPLYLCFLVPVAGEKARRVILTFLMDYNLLGAVMAFADMSGMLREHWSLTLHSVLWHVLVIALGVLIGLSGQGDRSLNGYRRATGLLLVFCLAAEGLNLMLYRKGTVNLFYINPYYRMNQPVFGMIAGRWGNAMGIASYIGGICIGGGIVHGIWHLAGKRKCPAEKTGGNRETDGLCRGAGKNRETDGLCWEAGRNREKR